MILQVPGGNKFQVSGIALRTPGGNLFQASSGYMRTPGGNLFRFFSALAASASPATVTGTGYSRGAITISTNQTTVAVIGGVPPYTGSWTTADAGWSAMSPTLTTTSFRSSGVGAGEVHSATFTYSVTDSAGNTASADVAATVENIYSGTE